MGTENRCKNCEQWAPPNASEDKWVYGICKRAYGVDAEPINSGAGAFARSANGYSSADLMTEADFGCLNFEPQLPHKTGDMPCV